MHFFCWLSQLRQPIKPHANTIIKYPLNFRHLLHWFGVSEHTGNKCIQHIHSPFVVCIVIAIDRIELMNKTQRSMILKKKTKYFCLNGTYITHIVLHVWTVQYTHIAIPSPSNMNKISITYEDAVSALTHTNTNHYRHTHTTHTHPTTTNWPHENVPAKSTLANLLNDKFNISCFSFRQAIATILFVV